MEDNADTADLYALLLGGAGYDVHVATCGRSGLDAAKLLRPSLMIVDVGLPGISGVDVARSVRADGRTPAMVIIAVTGDAHGLDRTPFDAVLEKPVSPGVLLRTVQSFLGA